MNIPLDMALALLSDERLDNTHPKAKKQQNPSNSSPSSNSTTNSATTYVATRRRHSKK